MIRRKRKRRQQFPTQEQYQAAWELMRKLDAELAQMMEAKRV